jgi:hypothetical protein
MIAPTSSVESTVSPTFSTTFDNVRLTPKIPNIIINNPPTPSKNLTHPLSSGHPNHPASKITDPTTINNPRNVDGIV